MTAVSVRALWELAQRPGNRMDAILTAEQKAFLAEAETLDNHPKAYAGRRVTVRCRCGETYTCERLEAYLSQMDSGCRLLLERFRKVKPCPACGFAEGRVVEGAV
ncbi:MAG: hypothetical protein QMD46_12430 [Methanomicrobiales archaeon]|nr:hypothetical protein [Methanomicrobiales archaeon]